MILDRHLAFVPIVPFLPADSGYPPYIFSLIQTKLYRRGRYNTYNIVKIINCLRVSLVPIVDFTQVHVIERREYNLITYRLLYAECTRVKR